LVDALRIIIRRVVEAIRNQIDNSYWLVGIGG